MRVMIFSWEYPPQIVGGMGQHVADLVPAMMAFDKSLELHVVTPTFSGQTSVQVNQRLTVHRIAVTPPPAADFFHGVRRANEALARAAEAVLADRGGFDLLHAHDWLVGFAAQAVHDICAIPILATIHATERGRYQGVLYGDLSHLINDAELQLAQTAAGVITCSKAMREEVREFFGVPGERIAVIPNGIDGSRFAALRKKDLSQFRARFAKPQELLVFSVGRLVYEKGADLLVEAAPQVLQQVPETKFVIGGRGPLLPSLGQRVAEMNLEDKVLLTGYLSDSDRDQLYVVADCCVFPSRYEPFGIVALEAMASGTPVVVSDVGGLATVVTHDETGLTTYPENIESLAWGIVRVLREPEAAARRAILAEEAVTDCLAWSRIAELTIAAYHRVGAQAVRVLPGVAPWSSQQPPL